MTPNSLEGKTLGKYRVLEPLGRGGMAQVYGAYHPQLDRYVAIKVLRSDLVEEEEFLARFQREARSVAGLRHPNIVQVYDFDIQDDLYYMVMELLEGDTLKAYLNGFRTRDERLSFSEMMRILIDALEGLAYAHDEGIVHRDIKPANIMLTRRGQAVLTDFGIAQIIGGTHYTISGALMGTLHYMAPEQGLEGHCDSRSDIYSLGIVFYEMLTGQPPFDADTPLAILMKHVNDPLPLPRKHDPGIPEPFERVVLKALAKRPGDRYQSANEMAQALKKAAKEASITIPDVLSLSQVDLAEPSSRAVAVFSGKAREMIPDAAFAVDDTDITLEQSLKGKIAAVAIKPQPASSPALPGSPPAQIGRAGPAVLVAVGIATVTNIFVAILDDLTASIDIFKYAWPMELYLGSLLLGLLLMTLTIPWLLIPAGLVLGNGVILGYYAITGDWDTWSLWLLNVPLAASLIAASIWLVHHDDNRLLIRRLGMAVALVSAVMVPITVVSAMFRAAIAVIF